MRVKVEPDRKGWAKISDIVSDQDAQLVARIQGDMDSLLVFVGSNRYSL